MTTPRDIAYQSPAEAAQIVALSGSARWPGLEIDLPTLAGYLGETFPLQGALSQSQAADCYIAFACRERVSGAAEAFRRAYAPIIESAARNIDASKSFIDEVQQRVAEMLFVGSVQGGPRIAQYRAQGPLSAWVRTTAKRVALRLASSGKSERLLSEDALANEIAESCDQELALLRATYSELFRQVLVAAIRELPARDRMLLQLNLVGGLSTVRIGKMYGLNQSTVSRQLHSAASRTFDVVKQRLNARLGIVSEELESLLALVRSHIEMTLSCLDDNRNSSDDTSPDR